MCDNSTRRIPASVTRLFSSNYLPSALAALSKDSRSDVWIGDSSASIVPHDERCNQKILRETPSQTNGKSLQAMVLD